MQWGNNCSYLLWDIPGVAGAEQEFGQEVQPGLQIALESQYCIFCCKTDVFKTPVIQIFPRACQRTGQLLTVFSFYYTSTVSGVSPVHGHFKGGRSVQTWAFSLQVPLGCD